MKNYGNSFVGGREAINAGKVPVWLSVDEQFPAGCTFPASLAGTTYPIGTAVYVASMGGQATVLETFEVVGAVAAAGTSVVLKSVGGFVQPAKGLVVGKASSGVIAKAIALPDVTSVGSGDHKDEYTFTITANALGELSDGDILVLAVEAGANKAQVFPTGLLLEDVTVGVNGGSGTIVTKGQILASRAASLSASVEAALANRITFVKEA